MQLVSFDTAPAFDKAAREWLAENERENSVILSTLERAVRRGTPARGWLVAGPEGLDLALWQIQPHFLQVSGGNARAAHFAAETIDTGLAGVVGPGAVADAFAESWGLRHGLRLVLHMEMTYHTLDRLERVALPDGRIRQATLDDLDRLIPLAAGATHDMNLPASEQLPEEVEKSVRQQIVEGHQFVWEVGSSIAAIASYADGLDGRGARLRGIYTPPEVRRQGYGTAITSALTELLLENGQAWVSLFADNKNPTSTGIYRRLGFKPELAYRTWSFE